MARFYKYRWLLLVLACIVLIISTKILYTEKSLSAYDYLQKASSKNPVFSPEELLAIQKVDDKNILFYRTQKRKYACALIKDMWYGYEIVGYSGVINDNMGDNYIYSSLGKGSDRTEICWGVLIDTESSNVYLGNDLCKIVKTNYPIQFYYKIGEFSDLPEKVIIK